MTKELEKEGQELVEKLKSDLEDMETNLNKFALLGCDARRVDIVRDAERMAKKASKIRSILEYYGYPIVWEIQFF